MQVRIGVKKSQHDDKLHLLYRSMKKVVLSLQAAWKYDAVRICINGFKINAFSARTYHLQVFSDIYNSCNYEVCILYISGEKSLSLHNYKIYYIKIILIINLFNLQEYQCFKMLVVVHHSVAVLLLFIFPTGAVPSSLLALL